MRAAVVLAAAAAWYLGCEAAAALAFPGYSYSYNYISDLGIPGTGTSGGRVIDSPLAWVMNAGFIGHGVLLVLGALLLARAARASSWRVPFLLLALVHGTGIVLVGVFPAQLDTSGSAMMGWHVIGAIMAIVGGNLAVIASGAGPLRGLVPGPVRRISIGLGFLGLACLAMLVASQQAGGGIILDEGAWERGAVYTVQAWELLVAATIAVTAILHRTGGLHRR
ncbi:DUF998 domain-containing protein [Lolliginicoccus suaedae]|uniref:DUF998 domain-containing protein n=1 Tax=Lolliginicoccus suaedae TaxID=2605429 RepID=UPI0011F0893C|nr:DUF998 domain-containing protein [Lolliginicoccus suaedae]